MEEVSSSTLVPADKLAMQYMHDLDVANIKTYQAFLDYIQSKSENPIPTGQEDLTQFQDTEVWQPRVIQNKLGRRALMMTTALTTPRAELPLKLGLKFVERLEGDPSKTVIPYLHFSAKGVEKVTNLIVTEAQLQDIIRTINL